MRLDVFIRQTEEAKEKGFWRPNTFVKRYRDLLNEVEQLIGSSLPDYVVEDWAAPEDEREIDATRKAKLTEIILQSNLLVVLVEEALGLK